MNKKTVDNTFDLGLGKVPPQAIDLEEAVLGAIMIESDCLYEVHQDLFTDLFYKENHKEICQSIFDLYDKSSPIDLLTVTDQLKKNGKLEFIGGIYYITELTSKVNSSANIISHLKVIKEKWLRREIIKKSSKALEEAYHEENDVFDDHSNLLNSLMNLTDKLAGVHDISIKKTLYENIKQLEEAKKGNITFGKRIGFIDLDFILGGWQVRLYILAARPGMGKTALMLQYAKYLALTEPVLIFSLEMTKSELVLRLQIQESRVSNDKIQQPKNLTEHDINRIIEASGILHDQNIFIDDSPVISWQEIKSKAIIQKKKTGLGAIFIDYIQLMKMPKAGTKNESIEQITAALKRLTKELEVPVIALSQLSRAVEMRGGDKRPQLSDLRDSGAIEQDADVVLFQYRPEYYGLSLPDDHQEPGTSEIIIAKNRGGRISTVYTIFKGEFYSFYDYPKYNFKETEKQETDSPF